MGKQRRNAL